MFNDFVYVACFLEELCFCVDVGSVVESGVLCRGDLEIVARIPCGEA